MDRETAYTYEQMEAMLDLLYDSAFCGDERVDVVMGLGRLSPLYRTVLLLESRGYSGREIGRELDINGDRTIGRAKRRLLLVMNGENKHVTRSVRSGFGRQDVSRRLVAA